VIWSRAASRPRTEEAQPTSSRERELLACVGAKDLVAFEKLYRLYQPRLVRFLGAMLQRSQLVEEVLDDTMMTVWQSAENFRGASKPSTWIFAIAYRKALKAKARWPDPMEDDGFETRVDPDALPDEKLQQQRLHNALLHAMQQLSPEHRAVVDLTYFHGLGYREIADIVGCPAETVKTRVFHARQRLRKAMPGNFADWL
jgi:RNA polymerase sigma factor (sigma-70 family)